MSHLYLREYPSRRLWLPLSPRRHLRRGSSSRHGYCQRRPSETSSHRRRRREAESREGYWGANEGHVNAVSYLVVPSGDIRHIHIVSGGAYILVLLLGEDVEGDHVHLCMPMLTGL